MLTFGSRSRASRTGTMCKTHLRNAEVYPPSRIARTNLRCPHVCNSSASIRVISRRNRRRLEN